MISKTHCPSCGFLMMMEAKDTGITYKCVNTHDIVIQDEGLGLNPYTLLEYLKRP